MNPQAISETRTCWLVKDSTHQIAEPFVTFLFDRLRAVSKRFLDELHDGSLRFEILALRILQRGRLYTQHGIGDEVVGVRGMQQLCGKLALRRGRLKVVFVFREVLGKEKGPGYGALPRSSILNVYELIREAAPWWFPLSLVCRLRRHPVGCAALRSSFFSFLCLECVNSSWKR